MEPQRTLYTGTRRPHFFIAAWTCLHLLAASYGLAASAASYRLRIEARGPQIQAFLDGALEPLLTVTDTNYFTGAFGFAAYSTGAAFDDLRVVAHAVNHADQWYAYPRTNHIARDISPLEWNGDEDVAMDHFYAWWWEHLPKNGGGHYAADLVNGRRVLILNTWWPYVYDFNRFDRSCPFDDIVFPPEDVTPPAALVSLGGIALDANRIGLYWEEPADNVGVTRYAVYRDSVLLRKTANQFVVDTRLSPGTTYRYVVKACDGSGNESAASPEVAVTTRPSNRAATLIDGQCQLLLISRPGVNCQIDWSTDLSGWTPLQSTRPTHPVTEVLDANPPSASARFYRAWKAG